MASKFFAWFDKVAADAPNTAVGKVMVANGFAVGHTGGGCLAWQKRDDATGWEAWICDEENGLGTDLDISAAEFLVGLHHDDGDYVQCDDALNLTDCLSWATAAA